MNAPALLKCKELAEQLGRGAGYITAMRRAGYVLLIPGRTTLKHAMAWLAANPDFQSTEWLHPSRTAPEKRKAKVKLGRRGARRHREHLTADK